MVRHRKYAMYLFVFLIFFALLQVFACTGGGNGGNGGDDDDDTGDDDTGDDDTGDDDDATGDIFTGDYVVFGYNDLGMHCMNEDFSTLMILPPFNTLHAQVIRRGEDPHITDGNVSVEYSILNNTTSSDKTNFWDYVQPLLGLTVAPDTGLFGAGLSGTMTATGDNDWSVVGIPLTPINDDGVLEPYPLAQIYVKSGGTNQAATVAVTPVSWEIRCDLCHGGKGAADDDILAQHDLLHGTNLVNSTPVFCGGCHYQAAMAPLSEPNSELPTLSGAMHTAHANRMGEAGLDNDCYACHPGVETDCLRGVHKANGMTCVDCHESMAAVGDAGRRPWVDEPRCGDCHSRSGFEFEQPGTLYRNSKGHHGVHCSACHGSPHAIGPSTQSRDNQQAQGLQGHAGVIDTCSVCHRENEDDEFPHRYSGGDDDDEDDDDEDDDD